MRAPAGAWQRTGISRDGGPCVEVEHVVWLQVDDVYADSRGFAGTTTYAGGAVSWEHEVGTPGPDSGRLEPHGSGLRETGDGYVELWAPLPVCSGEVGAWTAPGARIVRVGDHVVHVGAGPADTRSTGSHWVDGQEQP